MDLNPTVWRKYKKQNNPNKNIIIIINSIIMDMNNTLWIIV